MKTQIKLSMAVLAACFSFSAFAADAPKSMRGADVVAPDAVASEKAMSAAARERRSLLLARSARSRR